MAQSTQQRARTRTDTPDLMTPMTAFGPKAVEAWQEIINESVSFMTERLEKDLETQRALLNCKTPADLLKVQTDFLESTMAQYSEGAKRFMNLMAKANGTARGYDDVPL